MSTRASRPRFCGAAALVLVLSIVAGPLVADDEPTPAFRGVPLSVALERLRGAGLKILYSSDLVQADMRVLLEPRGRWPREILDEILSPHGLQSKPGPAGAILIVQAPPPGSIRGVVVLGGTEEKLPGVHVTAVGAPGESVTDAHGQFATGPLAPGAYVVQFQLDGFVSQSVTDIPVRPGSATRIRFEMAPRGPLSERVVVRPLGGSLGGGPATRQELDHDELQAYPELAHDPLLAVARLTGVASVEGAGSLHVRGGAGDEVAVVLDGLDLYAPYHLADRGGPISAIDSRNVAGMQLLSGAFPAEYGGEMSGVIELDSVTPSADLQTELAYSTSDARVVSRGGFGDGATWLLAVRRGDPSQYLDAIGADPNYRPQFWDAFGKTRFRLSERTSLSVDFLHAYDDVEGGDRTLVQTIQDPGTFRSRHASSYVWATVENVWSPRRYSRTLISVGRLESHRDGSSARVAQVADDRSTGLLGLRHDAWMRSGRHLWKWGAEIERLDASYRYVSTPAADGVDSRDADLDPSGKSAGVYVADRILVTRSLGIEVGVRWDGQTYVSGDDASLNPRFNLDYALSERTTLRAGWGYFSQAQKIHELQVEDGVTDFHHAQRAEHRVIGIEHVLPAGFGVSASAYQKLVDDPAPRFENVLDPGGFFPEAGADRLLVDGTRARAEGIELGARSATKGRVRWRASYAWARAEDEIDGRWVPRSWDQTHAWDVGVLWSPVPQWTVSIAGNYHSGRPTTPIGATPPPTADGSPLADLTFGARNSVRLPDYARLDAGVSRLFAVRRTALRAFLNLTNVLDRSNVCCIERMEALPLDDGSTTVAPVYRHGLPRLLTAGVTWTF